MEVEVWGCYGNHGTRGWVHRFLLCGRVRKYLKHGRNEAQLPCAEAKEPPGMPVVEVNK